MSCEILPTEITLNSRTDLETAVRTELRDVRRTQHCTLKAFKSYYLDLHSKERRHANTLPEK